jgi:hypothetical protein
MMTAVVAALAALSGVALGKVLDVLADSRRWLRDRRADAYGAFLGAAARYLSEAPTTWDREEATPQRLELDRVYGDLLVFGSTSGGSIAQGILRTLADIRRAYSEGIQAGEGVEQLIAEYQVRVDQFRSAAKSELQIR